MLAFVQFALAWPSILYASTALVAMMVVIAVRRKPQIPLSGMILILLGACVLALTAAGPIWNRPRQGGVAVMVDVSPSTRGADFRDPQKLTARIHQLLGDIPYHLVLLADGNHPADFSSALEEIPVDRTVFSPPADSEILLFSDAQFEIPPAGPPTYIVIDPKLEDPADAAVTRLELRGPTLAATISGAPRRVISIQGGQGPSTQASLPGSSVITQPLAREAATVSVSVSPGDRWPENDAMSLHVNPPMASERWWIGESAPDATWRTIHPANLPTDPLAYLAPSVIVLNNIAARQLTPAAMDRLGQYSRDLGGSIVLVGGDSAFAAGAYPGTSLETLSPLSSSPPTPSILWMLLADSSGSMSDDAGGASRWSLVSTAMVHVLPMLPPDDAVQVGQFSDVLRWWPAGKNARETAGLVLPPPDAMPHGPTNLEAALTRLARDADATTPKQLLLLSDCDARIDHPEALIDLLKQKSIHLHVLALAQGQALPALRQIASATAGGVTEQIDPKQWVDSVARLMQSALPDRIMQTQVRVDFSSRAAGIAPTDAPEWNRTWLKPDATALATAEFNTESLPMAAVWNVGRGQVISIAFSPASATVGQLAGLIAMKPRDPRFSITWDAGPELKLSIDAIDHQTYLNDLKLTLELSNDQGSAAQSEPIPQTAPGRYQISIPAPRHPAIATVRQAADVIDRVAVAGRYAPEFDALGNNHAAMQRLADTTGGAVIYPSDHAVINFPGTSQRIPLTPAFCAAGAILIAAGLARWRLA